MLLEQAALCSIFMSPPQLRRFGFRLIDAGNSFASVNQARKRASFTVLCPFTYRWPNLSILPSILYSNIEPTCFTLFFVRFKDLRSSKLGSDWRSQSFPSCSAIFYARYVNRSLLRFYDAKLRYLSFFSFSIVIDRLEDALGYMERLLVNNCQAPHKQSSFLREFLHIFQKVRSPR